MVVLIIGASGYVGKHLWGLLFEKLEVFGTYLKNPTAYNNNGFSLFLDIRDNKSVDTAFKKIRPDLIYHLAYDSQDLKGSIIDGTENVLQAKRKWCPGSRLIYLSTDAVFDGESGPYKESDIPSPVWPYGAAKRKAEIAVRSAGGTVVRTSLAPMDPRTSVLKSGLETGDFIYSYFSDEIRCPIFVEDLCGVLFELAYADNNEMNILHIAGPEAISRYEFACKLARFLEHDPKRIPRGIKSDSGEIRPIDLSMDISFAKTFFKTKLRSIEEVLDR